MEVIIISEEIAVNLSLRDIAAEFFDSIEKLSDNEIVIDFFGIESISGSFAHEYWTRKKNSKKTIKEINMPVYVEKTFMAVKRRDKSPRFEGLKSLQFVYL